MKKIETVIVLTLLIFIMSSCKPKDSRLLPDKNQQSTPFIYAPIPPFRQIFNVLDYLKMRDFDKAVDERTFSTKMETGRSSFALGVLTANAIISVRGHNKTKLKSIAEEMIKISNFLGLDESILRLADQLKELIDNDQWDELEKALEHYKNEVEGSLYQSQQYDQFTMMQLGGWVEGINRIAWFIQLNYQRDKTTVLAQKGTLNHLLSNMEYVSTPSIKESFYFKTTHKKMLEVKAIIDSANNDMYTLDQIKQLITITDEIKNLYRK